MIREGKKVELPKVELGNLGLHNASGYYVAKDPKIYPLVRIARKLTKNEPPFKKGAVIHNVYMVSESDIIELEEGEFILDRYENPLERLREYAQSLKDEHADLTDKQMQDQSMFIGHKRSARWEDERRRRKIIK